MKKDHYIISLLLFLLVVAITQVQGEHTLAPGKNALEVVGLISFTYPSI